MSTQPNQPTSSSTEKGSQPILPTQPPQDWFSFFQYKPERDSPNDVRNALLVVMALVAAVTFQAGTNPPGGVWPDTCLKVNTINCDVPHVAGTAILTSKPRYSCSVFFLFNTLAFYSSIYGILNVVVGFPFFLQIWVALLSIAVTYTVATVSLQLTGFHVCLNYAVYTVTAFLPLVLMLMADHLKKAWRRVRGTQ